MNHNKTSYKTRLLPKLEKPMHNNGKSMCHSEVPVPCSQDPAQIKWGFHCGSAGKEFACNAGDLGSIPGVGKISWRRERLPTLVFWPGEFHGLYSPWGHKESDMTERSNVPRRYLTAQLNFSVLGQCDTGMA